MNTMLEQIPKLNASTNLALGLNASKITDALAALGMEVGFVSKAVYSLSTNMAIDGELSDITKAIRSLQRF